MRLERKFLSSRVARRIFLLFVFCALLPISVLAVISFTQVTGQLDRQGLRRLHQSAKALGMSIMERLSFIENELKLISLNMKSRSSDIPPVFTREYTDDLRKRFMGLALTKDYTKSYSLVGHVGTLVEPSKDEKNHLRSGKSLLFTSPIEGDRSFIYMIGAVDPHDFERGFLYAKINALYLWGLSESDTLPAMTELCILDPLNKVIYATHPIPISFREGSIFKNSRSTLSRFQWKYEDKKYMAGYWPLFLKFSFFCPKWTVILSESKDFIEAPMTLFKKLFPLVTFVSLMLVLLLSIIQIRRTMHPLENLKLGTRRIANRDFESRVTVTSDDEFEELAESFNDMGRQLGRQFDALTAMSEIDRAVLSALDKDKIIFTAVTLMQEFLEYDSVSISLLDPEGRNPNQTYIARGKPAMIKLVDDVETPLEDLKKLIDDRELLTLEVASGIPASLEPLARGKIKSLILLPLLIKQELGGFIILGIVDSSIPPREDLNQARQLADQVAVALSNAKLLEDLDLMNWGTLTALARTVDAKSPWTAGHSERVTEKALQIGHAMGLSSKEMENLNQAGLLHDIGKIGIPVRILDKPGRLTEEEMRIVQGHSRMGARILEPIDAYAHVIPMVLQHHERFDGGGYPDGLAGEDIRLGARILAVADVFDALISDRPYRKGMALDRVIEILKKDSGTHFDTNVVEAFLEVLSRDKTPVEREKQEGIGMG